MSVTPRSKILNKAIEFAKNDAKDRDGSHNWSHIERVMKLATYIAKSEGNKNLEIVQLAAILHDVKDHKYVDQSSASFDAAEISIKEFLSSISYPSNAGKMIVDIVKGVSWKNETTNGVIVFPELAIVQDADRLDAIGAIGIARTFSYGGAKNKPLYHPNTKEQAIDDGSVISHFYDKLLKLKDLMKTETGRKIAEERHDYMVHFLHQFQKEQEYYK